MGQLKRLKTNHGSPHQGPQQEPSELAQRWFTLDSVEEKRYPCWDLNENALRAELGKTKTDWNKEHSVSYSTFLPQDNNFFITDDQGESRRTRPVPEIVLCSIVVSIRKCAHQNNTSPKTKFLYPSLQHVRWQSVEEHDRIRDIMDRFVQQQDPVRKREYFSTGRARLLEHTQCGFEQADSCIVETEMQWNRFLPPMIARFCGTEKMTPFFLEINADYEWFDFGGSPAFGDSDLCFNAIHNTLAMTALKNFENKDYWSKRLLKRLFDRPTVHKLVAEYADMKRQMTHTTQQLILIENIDRDKFVEWLLADRIRLLAAIIWINADPDCLYSLMEKQKGEQDVDIKDSQIPLRDEVYKSFLKSNHHVSFHHIQAGLGPIDFPEPMKAMEVQDNELIPIHYDKGQPLGEGGTSDVFKATIHSDYHAFSSNKNEVFALKIPRRYAVEDAQKEVKNWQRFARVPHPHINTLHTCWIQKEKFYMLSPLAELNLDEFLNKAANPELLHDAEWILEQLEGVASAIQHIHHVGRAGWDSSRTSIDRIDNGYHHDLKPANILIFGLKHWKITDFGTARVRQFTSSSIETSNFYTRDLPGGDEHYGGPDRYTIEHGPGRVGSAYDIWSFGCIMLEVLLWSFGKNGQDREGFERDRANDNLDACKCQPKKRSNKDSQKGSGSDSESENESEIKIPKFWYQCEKAHKCHVKPSVHNNLKWVKEQIKKHRPILRPLYDLVKDMLKVSATERPAASVIHTKLGNLRVQSSVHFAGQRKKLGIEEARADENLDFDLQTNDGSFARSSRMGSPPPTDEETTDYAQRSQPSRESLLKRRRASSTQSYAGTAPLSLGANLLAYVGDNLNSQAVVSADSSDFELLGEKEEPRKEQLIQSPVKFQMKVHDTDGLLRSPTSSLAPKVKPQKPNENDSQFLDWQTATRPTQLNRPKKF